MTTETVQTEFDIYLETNKQLLQSRKHAKLPHIFLHKGTWLPQDRNLKGTQTTLGKYEF